MNSGTDTLLMREMVILLLSSLLSPVIYICSSIAVVNPTTIAAIGVTGFLIKPLILQLILHSLRKCFNVSRVNRFAAVQTSG